MADWLSISTEDPLWLVKSFVLVTGVAAIPIILWYGFLALVRRAAVIGTTPTSRPSPLALDPC